MSQVKLPPPPSSADVIELEPLKGKLVAVKCGARRTVETKYGDRTLTEAVILVLGQDDPLQGVLFQSYFAKLEQDTWFPGKVAKSERQWYLDGSMSKAEAKAIKAQIERYEAAATGDDDVPF